MDHLPRGPRRCAAADDPRIIRSIPHLSAAGCEPRPVPFGCLGKASSPKLLANVVELRLRQESVSRDEVRALWLGAGLATHLGLAIFEEPERFITAAPSPITPAAALAA